MIADLLQQHPFLRLLIPLAGGILTGDRCFRHLRPDTFLLLGGVAGLFVLLVLCYRYRRRLCFGAATGIFFFLSGLTLVAGQTEKSRFRFTGTPSVYRVCMEEEPEPKERSMLCRATIQEEWREDTILPLPSRPLFLLYLPKDSAVCCLKPGDELFVKATLSPPRNMGIPDEFDYARYLFLQGVSGTAYVPAGNWRFIGNNASPTLAQKAGKMREKVVSAYRRQQIHGDELAVLAALTVGEREGLTDTLRETYSVSGASHVLALSGLHIGFLYLLFEFLFSRLWRRWKMLKPLLLLTLVALLGGFAFLTGLSSSVVRSSIMFSLLALSRLGSEKPLSLNTLSATAFLMLLFRPLWLFDVGFQLSFTAVLAILLIHPKLYPLCPVTHPVLKRVWGLTSLSIAAQIGTAPLVAFYFSRFSNYFLLSNLWAVPLVSLILYATVLFGLLLPFPAAQSLLASLTGGMVRLLNQGLQYIEQLPCASCEHICISASEVLLLYLGLLSIGYCRKRRTVLSVCFSLAVWLSLASWHAFTAWGMEPQRGITLYNIRGCTAVHCLSDREHSWLIGTDSLPDTSALRQALARHWNRMRITSPVPVSGQHEGADLFVSDQFIAYGGKHICLLTDHRWQKRTSATPLKVDYLCISKGYKGELSEVLALFNVGQVVIDTSVTSHYREVFAKECRRKGIPCTSLEGKASFFIPLEPT